MNYLYKCDRCLSEITVSHGMNEDPKILCDCLNRMHRVPQIPVFLLKGDGWASKDGKL